MKDMKSVALGVSSISRDHQCDLFKVSEQTTKIILCYL